MTKSFKQISTPDARSLQIVDSFNLGFRWMHSGAVDFLDEYIKTVDSFKNSFKMEKVIIARDMGSSSYRKNLYPEYKANRKEKQLNQTPEEKEKFETFFKEMMRIYDFYAEEGNYPVIGFTGVEADDIAAYITLKKKKFNIGRIKLVSTDRDWDLLLQDGIERFSYVTKKEYSLENWHEHYDFEHDEYISIKCLMGDAGDNVPGVMKVGPVTAAKLVKQYGSTYDIAANMPLPGKYVYIKNLNSFGSDALLLNYRLMDLVTYCEEAIGEENCRKIDEILEDYLND